MRTLFAGIRVTDLERSLAFYTALGYQTLGQVDLGDGRLVALSFPEESAVTLELVHRPHDPPFEGGGLDHLAVQVDDLAATVHALTRAGLEPEAVETPGGPDGPRTAWLTDPDGHRIELVQWPPGHPWTMTAADFVDDPH